MMTDFDVTKNRIPFGLLSEDEQTALIHWPHGWEQHWGHGWQDRQDPEWLFNVVYRGKPKPVVTSNWFNVYPYSVFDRPYLTRKDADNAAGKPLIAVLRIDTCNGVSTAHLEGV
jgi:hypothetical protein